MLTFLSYNQGKTHFIYGYMASDHSNNQREIVCVCGVCVCVCVCVCKTIKVQECPPQDQRLALGSRGRRNFPISSKGSFICAIPQTGWHARSIDDQSYHKRKLYYGATYHSFTYKRQFIVEQTIIGQLTYNIYVLMKRIYNTNIGNCRNFQ